MLHATIGDMTNSISFDFTGGPLDGKEVFNVALLAATFNNIDISTRTSERHERYFDVHVGNRARQRSTAVISMLIALDLAASHNTDIDRYFENLRADVESRQLGLVQNARALVPEDEESEAPDTGDQGE